MGKVNDLSLQMEEDAYNMTEKDWLTKWGPTNGDIYRNVNNFCDDVLIADRFKTKVTPGKLAFRNLLCILMSLDHDEVSECMTHNEYLLFREHPISTFLDADQSKSNCIYEAMIKRLGVNAEVITMSV